MSDIINYTKKRSTKDLSFAKGFDEGYQDFKIGVILKQAREEAGITQEELAKRTHTTKSIISRVENHAQDIRLSTLEKIVGALGKRLTVAIG